MGNNADKNNSSSMLQDVQRLYTQVKKDSRGLVLLQKSTKTYHLLKQYSVGSEEICKAKIRQLQAYANHKSQFVLSISRVQSKMFNNLCSTSYKIYALFEYPEITLSDEINARRREGKHFQQFQLWSILHSCINALKFMKNPVSFSPELVFINPEGHIKAINEQLVDEQSRVVPTQGYFYAPEKLQSFNKLDNQKSLRKQAVFSLGMTLLSAASLQIVNSCYNLPQKIFNQNKLSIFFKGLNQLYSEKIVKILTQMTKISPHQRISFEQLQDIIENSFEELETEQYQMPSQSIEKSQKQQAKSEEYCPSKFEEKKLEQTQRSLKQLQQSTSNQGQDYSLTVKFGKIKDLKPIQIALKPTLQSNDENPLEIITPKNVRTIKHEGLYTDPKLLQMIRKDLQDIGKLKQSAFFETGKYAYGQPQQTIFSSVKPYEGFQSNRQSLQNSSKPRQFLPYYEGLNKAADFKELKTQGVSENNTSTTSRVPSERESFKVQGIPVFLKKNQLRDAVYTIQTYEDGRHYEGMSINGKKQGRGRLTFQDGAYYEGQFSQDKMNGRGTLYYSQNNPAYEGNWLNDQFHGFGTLYNENSQMLQEGFDFRDFNLVDEYWIKFQGIFYMDNRNGEGKLHLSNGQCLSGTFRHDQIDGNCCFSCIDGTKIKGIWHKNILNSIIQQ